MTKKKKTSARVSSDHQKEDFERQVEILNRLYPGTAIIKNIGSGLNFKRKSLSLLDQFYSREVEEIIVLYRETDCVDLVLNSLSLSAKKLLAGLWFTAKPTLINKMSPKSSLKTSCLSSLFLLPETMDSELVGTGKDDENLKETKKIKEPAGKYYKIRLYPNKSQRMILNNWFGTARWTYNQVVSSIRQRTPRIKKDLRAKLINNANFKNLPWVTKPP
jgi:hypothetical protein